jgi:lysyl-tRNA synthetase class 1
MPFLETLKELRIEVRVIRGDEMYKSGKMNPVIVAALKGRDAIARILHEMTGKQIEADWSPFDPLCTACGRITATTVTGYSERDQTVDYRCECGSSGRLPMAGAGKLTWRVDAGSPGSWA